MHLRYVLPLLVILSSCTAPAERGAEGNAAPLSERAARLQSGMSRAEVVRLLGPADWAVLPGDDGELALEDDHIALELRWRNPGCAPVATAFDEAMQLVGWDEGRVCMDGAEIFNPDDAYSCALPDRQEYCGTQSSPTAPGS